MRNIVQCQGSPCHLPCREGRDCSLQQGGVVLQRDRYRVGHPRIPRDTSLFKTDSEMRSEGWEPVRLPEFLRRYFTGLGAIALAMLALWVIGMVGGLK